MSVSIDMNDIDNLFPSNYLKASDFPAPRTLTIASIQPEDMSDGKIKPIVRFYGEVKGWVLNKTNAESIKKEYGSQITDWVGKPVELFSMTVQGPNGLTAGIRCRVPMQSSQSITQNQSTTAPEDEENSTASEKEETDYSV